MVTFLLMLVAVGAGLLYQKLKKLFQSITEQLAKREQAHASLLTLVEQLRQELQLLTQSHAPVPAFATAPTGPATTDSRTEPVVAAPPISRPPVVPIVAVRPIPARPDTAPPPPGALAPVLTAPSVAPAPAAPAVPVLPVATEPQPAEAPAAPLAPAAVTPPAVASAPPVAPAATPPIPPVTLAAPVTAPASIPPKAAEPAITPQPTPTTPKPAELAAPTATPTPDSPKPAEPAATPQLPPTGTRPPIPARPVLKKPTAVPAEPAEPTWWERAERLLLDNWTGILGAVVLVTGIGFLGVYTALRMSAPARFGMITAFAAALLGLHYYLRPRPFAAKLNVWLQSSAAAVFLFACVGAASVPGLQWAGPPLSYLLLLAGVSLNLWLAWDTGREDVATLHGVLSLVALAVLPRELLTLAAAAGVTGFSIAITYRQRWKYQLLLSILSFFVFHQYWHYSLVAAGPLSTGVRLTALGLVLAVGVAGAVVQYRRVYASQRFDALLFSAHLLNWTCLGINLYQYSTGSPWKTVPLALGALLTFGVARRARRLGIQWLFRTDSIISLMLALFAAFSLQGWHASGSLVLLFMLLETLLVAFVMAREEEPLVFRVACLGAVAAGLGLVLLNLFYLGSYSAPEVSRNALVLLLAGLVGAGYYRLLHRQPLLADEDTRRESSLLRTFGGVVGLVYLGAAGLLARAIFGFTHPPLTALLGGTLAAAGTVFGVAWWLRTAGGWFRTLHLLSGQVLLTVFILGLHEAGLGWPATCTLLYFETLLLAGACGRANEKPAFRLLMGLTLGSGIALLLAAVGSVREVAAPVLYQRLGLLLLSGLGSAALLARPPRHPVLQALLHHPDDNLLFQCLRGLTLFFYGSAIGLLTQALFGLPHPPVAALLSAATVAAGLTFGLAHRVRAQTDWFRLILVLLGQGLLTVFVLGLHEAGLNWPAAHTLLYGEMLAFTLLLAWRAETLLYRILLGSSLVWAAALPLLVYHSGYLPDGLRAGLLLAAALASGAVQAVLAWRKAPVFDAVPLPISPVYRLRLLGLAVGGLLLAAGGLMYTHTWAGWVGAGLGGLLLLLRRRVTVPGLWPGLLLATLGYQVLQWSQVLPVGAFFRPLAVLAYLMPLLAIPALGLLGSWWAAAERHVRWPWLYLLCLQAVVATWVAFAPRAEALPVLLWTALAALAAGAAQLAGRRWATPAAQARAGSPGRFLRHLTCALLTLALVGHFDGVFGHSAGLLLGLPARRFTASALLLLLTGLAFQRPPAPATATTSWHYVQPLLPECALLFGCFTFAYELQTEWLALIWLGLAFGLTLGAQHLPPRLRRVRAYGLLLFWAAVAWSTYVSLNYLAPDQLLTVPWLTTATAVVLLFGYIGARLHRSAAEGAAEWPPLLAPLAGLDRLPYQGLVGLLLYPAFLALTALLTQSFDRSVLTVLLMVEVVAAFVASLLLRRQDLRYAALLGMVLAVVRLFLVDLRQTGTVTRAVVFILMGLLLLGMNALYARFKDRFAPPTRPPDDDPDLERPADPLPTLH